MHITSRAPVLSATSSRVSVWIMIYFSQLNPIAPPWHSRSVLVPSAMRLLGLEQAATANETRHRKSGESLSAGCCPSHLPTRVSTYDSPASLPIANANCRQQLGSHEEGRPRLYQIISV